MPPNHPESGVFVRPPEPPLPAEPTVSWVQAGLRRNVNVVAILAGVAAERGMAAQQLFTGTSLSVQDIEVPECTISFDQEFRLIRNLLRHCDDETGLGLVVGERYRLTSIASLGFAFLSSRTVRDAAELAVRYANHGFSLVRVLLDRPGGDLHLAFLDSELPPDVGRFASERTIAVGLASYGRLLGRKLVPRALEFSFPRPRDAEVYEQRLGVRPSFGAPRTRLVLAQADVDEPLPDGNAVALQLAEAQCRQLVAEALASRSLAQRVERMVASLPSRYIDMRVVAAELCMSERTLRRHLQREGTSFTLLCERARQRVAEQLLAVRRLPIDQIAEHLGYAEASSFIHAFKRWRGSTPHAFRLALLAPQPGQPT